MSQCYVYFLQQVTGGPIKIGNTYDPELRSAVELYHGRARRIEAWEMRRAEDAVVLLTFRRAGGPVAVSEREVK